MSALSKHSNLFDFDQLMLFLISIEFHKKLDYCILDDVIEIHKYDHIIIHTVIQLFKN